MGMYWIRILASICLVLLWFQLFFWLRLFDRTAQYVDLIISTAVEISDYMLLLYLLLFMFGTGIYMI